MPLMGPAPKPWRFSDPAQIYEMHDTGSHTNNRCAKTTASHPTSKQEDLCTHRLARASYSRILWIGWTKNKGKRHCNVTLGMNHSFAPIKDGSSIWSLIKKPSIHLFTHNATMNAVAIFYLATPR